MMRRCLFVLPMVVLSSYLLAAENGGQGAEQGALTKTPVHLALGLAAPEISTTGMDGKGMVLAGLRTAHPDKIIVLQFASLTDPVFRAHVGAVEKLAGKYADKAAFVIVYQREAHAADSADPLELNASDGFNIAEPTSFGERQKLAQQAIERLQIKNETVVVDAWNNASALRYGSYPNMTFIIDAKGNLQAGYPWMDAGKVKSALDVLAAGQPLPAELKGNTTHSGPAVFDFAGAAMDMTGGRGPATIANVLDKLALNDRQKVTVFPAIAEFLADLQEFRRTASALPGGRGGLRGGRAGGPAATLPATAGGGGGKKAPPGAAGDDPDAKPVTLQDVESAQASLRQAADKLQTVVKQELSPNDATTLLTALASMAPNQRLFGGQ